VSSSGLLNLIGHGEIQIKPNLRTLAGETLSSKSNRFAGPPNAHAANVTSVGSASDVFAFIAVAEWDSVIRPRVPL
jgi:hypothetical protein